MRKNLSTKDFPEPTAPACASSAHTLPDGFAKMLQLPAFSRHNTAHRQAIPTSDTEKGAAMVFAKRKPDDVPPFRGVPVITVILLMLLAGAAALHPAYSSVTPAFLLLPSLSAGFVAFVCYISASRKPLLLAIPVAVIALLLSQSAAEALLSLLFLTLLPAAGGAVSGWKSMRVPLIISAVSAALLLIAAAGSALLVQYGTVSADVIKEAAKEPLDSVRSYITSIRTQYNGELYAVFSAQQAEAYINYLLGLLPAIIGICALLMAWGAAWVLYVLNRIMRLPEIMSPWELEMPASACILFAAALLLINLVGNAAGGIPEMAAANVFLLLLPGFLVSGVHTVAGLVRSKKKPGLAALCILLPIAASLFSPVYSLLLLALFGMQPGISRGLRLLLKSNRSQQ